MCEDGPIRVANRKSKHSCHNYLTDRQAAQMLDNISRVIFPVAFLVFNGIYWTVYLNPPEKKGNWDNVLQKVPFWGMRRLKGHGVWQAINITILNSAPDISLWSSRLKCPVNARTSRGSEPRHCRCQHYTEGGKWAKPGARNAQDILKLAASSRTTVYRYNQSELLTLRTVNTLHLKQYW